MKHNKQFPIKKSNIYLNDKEHEFLSSYIDSTEIPLLPHPGAFGKKRKHHCHEGIDLYCLPNETIYAIEAGIIVNIYPFTGEIANSPWWHNTYAVMIEGETGVFNYGEIIPAENITIGQFVSQGTVIGNVTTVLKKDKGRPMNMLHLELYQKGTTKGVPSWPLNTTKPNQLLDPTTILLNISNIVKY